MTERGVCRSEDQETPRRASSIIGPRAGTGASLGDEIGVLFVLPDFARRGIGRSLADHALSMRETLEVEVFARNAIGRAFYAGYGFVPTGTGVGPGNRLRGAQARAG